MRKQDPLFPNAAGHDPGKPRGVDNTAREPSLYAAGEFRYDK